MINSTKSLCVLGVGLAMVSGCATDVAVDENVGFAESAIDSCSGSNYGKWQHLANLAVATAQEMGELNTTEQFTVGTIQGTSGPLSAVTLSAYGQATCAAKGGCPMVEALLDLQSFDNDVLAPQAVFNVLDYRNTLVSAYYNQLNQTNSYLNNKLFGSLPEDHSTTLIGQDGTATCGTPWFSFSVKRDFHFKWSSSGPIADMNCTQLTEPTDPDGWDNNYLCSERNIGMKWSNSGTIAGMTCLKVTEGSDPYAWGDNYLCTPENWGLVWSMNGPLSGKKCINISEPNDPHAWANNYLCWDATANLNHPSTLCTEFMLFGGAAACNGDNPYIDFVVSTDLSRFKIDPTDYTSSTITTGTTGSCVTSLPYISTKLVAPGSCCYVSSISKYGVLTKYPTRTNTYYCKTP